MPIVMSRASSRPPGFPTLHFLKTPQNGLKLVRHLQLTIVHPTWWSWGWLLQVDGWGERVDGLSRGWQLALRAPPRTRELVLEPPLELRRWDADLATDPIGWEPSFSAKIVGGSGANAEPSGQLMNCDKRRKFGRDRHLPALFSVVCLEYGTAGGYL